MMTAERGSLRAATLPIQPLASGVEKELPDAARAAWRLG